MKKLLEKKTVKKVMYGAAQLLAAMAMMLISVKMNAYASPGEEALGLITENASALGWAVLACVLLTILSKRNWVGAAVTAVVGAAVCFVIGKPMILQKIGETIISRIFGS